MFLALQPIVTVTFLPFYTYTLLFSLPFRFTRTPFSFPALFFPHSFRFTPNTALPPPPLPPPIPSVLPERPSSPLPPHDFPLTADAPAAHGAKIGKTLDPVGEFAQRARKRRVDSIALTEDQGRAIDVLLTGGGW